MFKLVISDDEGKQTTVPLVRDEITIGRKEGNTIRLTERNVSRRHARLQKQNGSYLLHDLGSYNGVVINGARLLDPHAVKNGDQILIGDYKLAILEEATAQIQAPPPGMNGAHETLDAPVPVSAPPPQPMAAAAPPPPPPAATQAAPPSQASHARISAPPMPATSTEAIPDEIRTMRLVFLAPAGAPAPVTLDRLPLILGRSEVADISLPFSSISREHARLSVQGGSLIIEDLGSSNGVSVNGNKAPRAVLSPGDLVTLGVVEFRVARRGDSTVVMTMPPPPNEAKKRSPLGIVIGLVGVGVVIGGVAIALRGSGNTNNAAPTASAPQLGTPGNVATAAAPTTNPTPTPAAPTVAATGTPEPAQAAPPPAPTGRTAPPNTNNHPSQLVAMAPTAPPDIEPPPAAVHTTSSSSASRSGRSSAGNNAAANPTPPPPVAPVRTQPSNPITPPPNPTPPPPSNPTPPPPVRTTPPPPPTNPTPPPAAAGADDPLANARACRGDNACVVAALENHARTEQELGMLAVTYRIMGNRAAATRTMQQYLRRWPSGPRAESFHNYIDAE